MGRSNAEPTVLHGHRWSGDVPGDDSYLNIAQDGDKLMNEIAFVVNKTELASFDESIYESPRHHECALDRHLRRPRLRLCVQA
jgi:hypothetical protein